MCVYEGITDELLGYLTTCKGDKNLKIQRRPVKDNVYADTIHTNTYLDWYKY